MHVDGRKEKRAMRKMGMEDQVYFAYCNGEWYASKMAAYHNPYPPGRRHDEFKRGYNDWVPSGNDRRAFSL